MRWTPQPYHQGLRTGVTPKIASRSMLLRNSAWTEKPDQPRRRDLDRQRRKRPAGRGEKRREGNERNRPPRGEPEDEKPDRWQNQPPAQCRAGLCVTIKRHFPPLSRIGPRRLIPRAGRAVMTHEIEAKGQWRPAASRGMTPQACCGAARAALWVSREPGGDPGKAWGVAKW